MNFNENLKTLRIKYKITQPELANKLNVKQYVISSWEIGRSEPNINQLIELSKIFNCSLDYLLGLSNDSDPLDNNILLINDLFKKLNEKEKETITEIVKKAYELTKKND